MTEKVALFAFNGDPMCFIHVLLNTLDMKEKGYDVKLVIEGSATKLIDVVDKDDHPLNGLYQQVVDGGLIDCVCRACSNKMGTLDHAQETGLPVCGDMSGHPAVSSYMERGYEIMVF